MTVGQHNQGTLESFQADYLRLDEIGFDPSMNIFVGIDWLYGFKGMDVHKEDESRYLYVFPAFENGSIVPDKFRVVVREYHATTTKRFLRKPVIRDGSRAVDYFTVEAKTVSEFRDKVNSELEARGFVLRIGEGGNCTRSDSSREE